MDRLEHWMYRHERWMYRDGHPNRLASALNRLWALAGSAGLGRGHIVTLEVRGRRSGRTISFPLIVANLADERYLVSMLGEQAQWVANVRAAGGHAVLRHGRTEAVRLVEVDPERRAPILRRHLEVAPAARSFTPVDRRAPLAAFARVAGRFPVFLVQPAGPVIGQAAAGRSPGSPRPDLGRPRAAIVPSGCVAGGGSSRASPSCSCCSSWPCSPCGPTSPAPVIRPWRCPRRRW